MAEAIDLRSDTVTRPSAAMRTAMAQADVGDDVLGEDPTVIRLQTRVAELLGKEAALFVPSGSMANQIALKIHCEPGDDVLIGQGAHNYFYEAGGASALAGVQCTQLPGDGRFDADAVRAASKVGPPLHHLPATRLVCVENTHNRGGGLVWDQRAVQDIAQVCQELDLRLHLDGARLLNAVAATDVPAAEWAAPFDTASICFSKGLGAPVGSAIAGSTALITRAHRFRKMLGGGMRQAGILAAGALYALDNNVQRLKHDHENAKGLAQRLAEVPGVRVSDPQSNILMVDLEASVCDAERLVQRAAAAGLRLMAFGHRRLRLVTHLDVSADACKQAAEIIANCLSEAD